MGWKYHIFWADYPYKGSYKGDYGTNSFIKCMFKLFVAMCKYEIVEFSFRKQRNEEI